MDKKIVEYIVLKSNSTALIAMEVNERIKDGRQPLGTVVIDTVENNFVQAMVKYE